MTGNYAYQTSGRSDIIALIKSGSTKIVRFRKVLYPQAQLLRAFMPRQAYTVERLNEAAKIAEEKAKEYAKADSNLVTLRCRWPRMHMNRIYEKID